MNLMQIMEKYERLFDRLATRRWSAYCDIPLFGDEVKAARLEKAYGQALTLAINKGEQLIEALS